MIRQTQMMLSNHADLYDILIPSNHILRQLKELVDFSFVNEMLHGAYTHDNGRPAYRPEMMFKYLFLKNMYDLSDRDLVDRCRTDLAFKFFLGLAPEDDVIDPTSLTKFRKLRIKDDSIMDELIKKSLQIAMENGIRLSHTMIVDSTHTETRYGVKSAREYLLDVCKTLRKKVYAVDESMHDRMPSKPDMQKMAMYETAVEYCRAVAETVKAQPHLMFRQDISESLNLLEENIEDVNEELEMSKDQDARIGHKTADTAFFGYKTHIAMTPERIITAAVVTSGEKADGKQTQELIEKMNDNGVPVEAVVGDGAYSEKEIIEYINSNNIKLVSKLSKTVTEGNRKNELDHQFTYNKDAKMYVCPQGHMAVKKATTGKNDPNRPTRESYFFDVTKCRNCPLKDKCGFKDTQKSKTYNVTIEMSPIHAEYQAKQETQEYRDLAHARYKIEARNAELKNRHGYGHTTYTGLHGMTLQVAVSIFVVNVKRINTLLHDKNQGKQNS